VADSVVADVDPLQSHARARYRGMIVSFMRGDFTCPTLPAGATRCHPTASFTIAADRTVTSVSFSPCGEATIDAAAKTAATSRLGETIPPPPENYPELLPTAFAVAYACKER
jgi:hypothetical protein